MKNKTKTALRILLIAIAAVIVGVNVYTLNAVRLGGDPVPMPFGVGVAVVLSGSMEPELSVGDLILIAQREQYEVGDVVVYRDGKSAVVHRLQSIDGDPAIAMGDANNVPDEPFATELIKGEVVVAIPLAGHLVNLIKTPVATVIILVLAVVLMERSFHRRKQDDEQTIRDIRAEIERLKNETNSQEK